MKPKIKLLLLIVAVFMASNENVAGQNTSKIDSLKNLIATAKQDTNLAMLYDKTGWLYSYFNVDTAVIYCRQALKLSEKLDFAKGKIAALTSLSSIANQQGDYDEALLLKKQVLEIARKTKDETEIGAALFNLALNYRLAKDYKSALDLFLQARPFLEKSGNTSHLASWYNGMQRLYYDMQLFEKGVEYGEKGLELIAGQPNSIQRLNILLNLSKNYMEVRPPEFDKSQEALNEVVRIAKVHNELFKEADAYLDMGANYYLQQNFHPAEIYYAKARDLLKQLGSKDNYAIAIAGLADCEEDKGNFRQAGKYFSEALSIAEENNYLELRKRCYLHLSFYELYINRNPAQRYYYMNLRDSISTLLINDEVIRSTSELEVKYETEKKELQLAEQKAVIGKQKVAGFALAGGLLLSVVILVLLWHLLNLRRKRNVELAEMNATKDQFFSIIAHDLRSPAIAQRNALQTLLNYSDEWDVEALKQFYSELLDSADIEVQLLNNLLNWAQIETGRMPFKPQVLDVKNTLQNEIALMQHIAAGKNIEFKVSIPEGTIVAADANMFATICRNLLSNAVKFTDEGGKVELQAETRCNESMQSTFISVSDTGKGMTQEQIDSILSGKGLVSSEATGHLSAQYTSDGQNTGLGLIVVREMLEKHSSTLLAESRQGIGSTFQFEIKKFL